MTAIFDQHPRSVIVTDTESTILYVNARFTELTGYSREEAIGATPRVLKSGRTDASTYEELWKTITEGSCWRGELLDRKKSGEFYWASVLIHPVRDESGQIAFFAGFQDDITEQKADSAQAKLEAAPSCYVEKEVSVQELRTGMILRSDAVTTRGVLLMKGGHEISRQLLARIIRLHSTTPLREPLSVRVPAGRPQGGVQ